ncbi:MAG: hypothetical protein JO040_12645, partial [Gemmatimonadetes bacterium]|nr:hypothetical protein [Gemmatimonadota bacterium]
MYERIDNFIIRRPDGIRYSNSLVIGPGISVTETAGGIPEITGFPGEVTLMPCGNDDTAAIRAALAVYPRVRLGPGTFHLGATVTIEAGREVVGLGPSTVVLVTHTGIGFNLTGDFTAIENLGIFGSGDFFPGHVAVSATGVRHVRLRQIVMASFGRGIELNQVSNVLVSGVDAEDFGTGHGISVVGPGDQVSVTDIRMNGAHSAGINLVLVNGVRCEGVVVQDSGNGIRMQQVRSAVLGSAQIYTFGPGLLVQNSSSVEIAGVQIEGSNALFRIENTSGAVLGGCGTVESRTTSLTIRGGTAVTVDGFSSAMAASLTSAPPHVLVDGGSTLVMLSGVHRVNPTTP